MRPNVSPELLLKAYVKPEDDQTKMDQMYLSVMVDLYVRLATALHHAFENDQELATMGPEWRRGFRDAALAVHLIFRPNHADELDFFLGLGGEADDVN